MEELPHRRFSDELSCWLNAEGEKTLGSIISTFEQKSFAVLFVLLLGPPALPLPTGGATHVLEVIAMLLALQLLIGHEKVWLPRRWCAVTLAGPRKERFLERLLRLIRWLERRSRPRGRIVFGHRASNVAFGVLAMIGTLGAFVAPPFSGLDTLPSLGVVLLSLGVLLEDALIAAVGIVVTAAGITLVVLLGRAAVKGVAEIATTFQM